MHDDFMAVKARYNVSLPDHVSSELEKHAKAVKAAPTEYAGDIIRWWYGQGCPPVTPDEIELRKRGSAPPQILDVWSLGKHDTYSLTDDKIVKDLLSQLGIPNLFAPSAEHDVVRMTVIFDNHPTHWLVINLFKGSDRPEGDGLSFYGYPKSEVPLKEILSMMERIAKEMEATEPMTFSQIPSKALAAAKAR